MSVSGISSSNIASMMQSAARPQKPDAADMAAQAFARLDVDGKGYIDKSDLASALESTGDSASSVDELFGNLDSDSDGKVTEQELASTLQKVADQFEDSFGAARVGQAMGNRPPPPPPPAGEDEGMTVDELSAMAEEAEASGSAGASELSALAESFDEADTDGDGKVSFQEAMAFRESNASAGEGQASARPAPPDEAEREDRVLARVLEMLSQYDAGESSTTSSSTLSVSA